MSCKISVIQPVYNAAQYLEQNLACWTGQTLADIELIYVDDGSTDDSLRILQDCAKKDSRIHLYVLPENKGTWAARNLGIEKAHGKYILFADADDTVLPETCEELARAMDESQADILQYSTEVLNAGGLPKQEVVGCERFLTPYDGTKYGKEIFAFFFKERKSGWCLHGKVFRTELCKNVLSYIAAEGIQNEPLRTAEDGLLFFMLSFNAQIYKGLPAKKYYQYYFGRGGSGHNYYTLQYFRELCAQNKIASLMNAFLEKQGKLEAYKDVALTTKKRLLACPVLSWADKLPDDDKVQGFDLLLRHWDPADVIGSMAELRFHDGANMARWIQNAASLKYDGRPVKTIAAHIHGLAVGESGQVACLLCRLWLEMGYRVFVLTDLPPTEADYALPDGIERIALPPADRAGVWERASALSRIIKERHIDAVVSHCGWSPSMLWDELAVKTAGAAFIVHQHSTFSRPLIEGWKRCTSSIAPYSLADAVVALNEASKKFWSCCNANVHVTLNPLPESLSSWTPAEFQPNHQILWLAGMNSLQENPMDLVPIMEEVVRVVPDAVLHVVGKSEDGSIEVALKKETALRHLEKHVVLEGFHADVKPWYQTCQLFLMTSAFAGCPMTLAESKMAGIPCVMYELPYLILCEGNRGILPVPQRDTNAAARAIIKLLTDDELCVQMGREARAHIEELAGFDLKGKWCQIFESVGRQHEALVSAADRMMMDTIIRHHEIGLRNVKITRKEALKVLIPNTLKRFIKAILRRIPSGVKKPVKRLLHW